MAQSACHYPRVADRKDSDREVLTSLPRTRPVRRSAKRGESPRSANAAKPKATAAAKTSKARATAARPRATTQPKTTARPARPPAAGPTAAGATAPRSRTAPRRAVPPAGYASPSQAEDDQRSASADLIGTAVQAATELAQIGCAVGRQALQSMLDRLPKP
jgi:hypothetical protein